MTRKEELAARARDYVSLFVMSGAEPAATKNLTWMLEQVEREVLDRVATHIGGWRESDPPEEWPLEVWKFVGGERDKLAEWVRAQQQELE